MISKRSMSQLENFDCDGVLGRSEGALTGLQCFGGKKLVKLPHPEGLSLANPVVGGQP